MRGKKETPFDEAKGAGPLRIKEKEKAKEKTATPDTQQEEKEKEQNKSTEKEQNEKDYLDERSTLRVATTPAVFMDLKVKGRGKEPEGR